MHSLSSVSLESQVHLLRLLIYWQPSVIYTLGQNGLQFCYPLFGKVSIAYTFTFMMLSVTVTFQNKGTAAFSISFSHCIYITSHFNSLTAESSTIFYFMLKNKFTFYSENNINTLNPELNPICHLLALLAHHFLHVSRMRVKSLTLRLLLSYIYVEHLFLMFLDHTQRRSTVGMTPLDE